MVKSGSISCLFTPRCHAQQHRSKVHYTTVCPIPETMCVYLDWQRTSPLRNRPPCHPSFAFLTFSLAFFLYHFSFFFLEVDSTTRIYHFPSRPTILCWVLLQNSTLRVILREAGE